MVEMEMETNPGNRPDDFAQTFYDFLFGSVVILVLSIMENSFRGKWFVCLHIFSL